MITYPEVQENLGLDEQQKERIGELKRESSDLERELLFTPPDLNEESPFSAMAKMMTGFAQVEKKNDEISKQIQDVLTSEQRRRFEQISLQAQGAEALFRPEIVKALGITPAQQNRLAQMRQQAAWESHQLMLKAHASRDEKGNQATLEAMAKVAKMQKRVEQRMLTQVLTARQKAKLKQLQGEKLELADHGSHYGGGVGISGGSSGGISGGGFGSSGGFGSGFGSSGAHGGGYRGGRSGGASGVGFRSRTSTVGRNGESSRPR
jgi:hypothetical protein